MSDPIEPDDPVGPTGIVQEMTIHINAWPLPWSELTISFAQVVEEWNHLEPDRQVLNSLQGGCERHTLDRLASFAAKAFKHRITYQELSA